MENNKIQTATGEVLIDLTNDTVTEATLLSGATAHNKAGEIITGTYAPTYDTPSITVSSGGLITASANGKSNTQQLTVQAGKTVTPSESEQTAVASGRYTTGTIKVGAISSTYVGSGVTKQAAKTVTPTESQQTAVASGVYTTGAITVSAISNTYIGSAVKWNTIHIGAPPSTGLVNGDVYIEV